MCFWVSHPPPPLSQVERGSPKSCFLFLGEVLCEVNWVSVLSDSLQAPPPGGLYPPVAPPGPHTHPDTHTMLVYLLYMLVFLTKEEPLLSQPVSTHYQVYTTTKYTLLPSIHYYQVYGTIKYTLLPSLHYYQVYTTAKYTLLPSIRYY